MAKIIQKSAALERKYRAKRNRARRCLLLSLAGFAAAVAGVALPQPVLLAGGAALCFICILIALFPARDLEILRSGVEGERAAARLLERLPESCRCFQNVVVSYRGKTSEMDMVVVSPAGVFIIEIKNLNGHITGAFDDTHWTQHKTGRRGGAYEKQLYSPIKQVGTHIYRLAHALRERGCRVHINGAVLFCNPDATLSLTGTPGDIPVFAGADGGKQLLRHITAGSAVLSPETRKELFRLLQEL